MTGNAQTPDEGQKKYPVIGLTGLACSGKSAASEILDNLGAYIIDVDRLGHQALYNGEIKNKLLTEFGEDILTDGEINRKKLGTIVFSNEKRLISLEQIVHPWMCEKVFAHVMNMSFERPVVIDAALLQYMGLDSCCDVILLLESEFPKRLKRAQGRGWSRDDLYRRDQSLIPKILPESCFTVENNEDFEYLKNTLTFIYKDITDE